MGRFISAMQTPQCHCIKTRAVLGDRTDAVRCDVPCPQSYFNGTTRLCGGTGQYYSVYQKYDSVHQTAQGCYDPWRFIWYQAVSIEVITTDNGVNSSVMEWYLHGASINSGDP